MLFKKLVKFKDDLLVSHTEVDEQNLFECTSLSFFNSAVERFNAALVINLILLVTEGSEI